eukprot:scaffold150_cov151-Skeletonema_menzelii.AAC.9
MGTFITMQPILVTYIFISSCSAQNKLDHKYTYWLQYTKVVDGNMHIRRGAQSRRDKIIGCHHLRCDAA